MVHPLPRILVIESDHNVRVMLRDTLEANGYQVLATANWLDPEDIRQLRPIAILLEPFVDEEPWGWDYLRVLRAQPGMQRLPVVVCTANHDRLRDVTAAELDLATTVILKPLDADELLDTISTVTAPSEILEPLPWPGVTDIVASRGFN